MWGVDIVSETIREEVDAIVIGGGPAGSSAARLVAASGHSTVLLERAQFPRFHIGESMLTYTAALLDRLGVREEVDATDFPVKTGAEFCDVDGGYTRVDFTDQGAGRELTTYQVERSAFDDMLLRHAAKAGVDVRFGARVTRFESAGERLTGVTYTQDGVTRHLSARRIIDASGRAGVISTGVLRSRRTPDRLRMVAAFRHYDGVREATNPGVSGDIQIGSHADGWVWAIPIRPERISVGAVTRPEILQRMGADRVFDEFTRRIPRVHQRIADLTEHSETRVESDFTYFSDQVAGPGYLMAGDAGCFVDPIFSAGVYLALTSGIRAGETTVAILDGAQDETEATELYSRFYKTGYDTYFRLIYAFYEHDFRLGRFLKSTGARVAPIWIARLLGGDFWSQKNPLARHLRTIEAYRSFAPYEPLYGCPVYPELEAAERDHVALGEPANA